MPGTNALPAPLTQNSRARTQPGFLLTPKAENATCTNLLSAGLILVTSTADVIRVV